jgi:hypothetical protein
MSVVQRCPNCGTTSSIPGECEACHDAQVRYFCTNHAPGIWLDASTCPSCGARFGEPARAAARPATPARTGSAAPVAATPRRTRSAAPARAPAATPAPPRRYSPAAPPDDGEGAWSGRMRSRRDDGERVPGAPRMPPWQQILQAVLRARYMPERGARYRERPPIERVAGGCLKRGLIGMLLLFLALGSALFVFGRALLG